MTARSIYNNLEELQQDVDLWIKQYNELRPHSGKYCYGKTPMQTFIDSKHIAQEKNCDTMFLVTELSDNSMYHTQVVR